MAVMNTLGFLPTANKNKKKKKKKKSRDASDLLSARLTQTRADRQTDARGRKAIMDPNTTILRVKRKRGTDPADALLLACKRIRPESTQSSGETVPEPDEAEVENSVFKLVATVATQDAPVQTQVRQALARPRAAHALRPSASSSQRIMGDLRSTKWSTRREERYRILSSHRTGLLRPAEQETPQAEASEAGEDSRTDKRCGLGEIQVVDLVQEDEADPDKPQRKTLPSDPEVILCNNTKLLRERLAVSGEKPGVEHREHDDDYVYDLYYQETVTLGWIQDILSVRAYADDGELVPDLVVREEEVYDDEDDENEESNWRNDYPDEDSGSDSDREQRYGDYWEEEHSYCRRDWQRYQKDVLQELGCSGEDDDEDKYDSD